MHTSKMWYENAAVDKKTGFYSYGWLYIDCSMFKKDNNE